MDLLGACKGLGDLGASGTEDTDRAAGRMFPRVYLEVPVRVYLRVSLWMTARAPL